MQHPEGFFGLTENDARAKIADWNLPSEFSIDLTLRLLTASAPKIQAKIWTATLMEPKSKAQVFPLQTCKEFSALIRSIFVTKSYLSIEAHIEIFNSHK